MITVSCISSSSLVIEVRTELDAWRTVTTETVPDRMLALARVLHRARQSFARDQEFGAWLAQHELDDIGKDDRAALIHLAEYPEQARAAIIETGNMSPRYVWDSIKDRVRICAKPPSPESAAPESPQQAASPVENANQSHCY